MLSSRSDRYRPDIDGLRAIAVLLVVNFHAFPEAIPGGFIGVDIFFVISGFLITDIVTRELAADRFSLLHFYDRRIRRIFPALLVVLLAVLVLGFLWTLPDPYARLSADVVASAAFAANIALLLQSGYFDLDSARNPLLHLWSLGIEEQFYLVWPPVLMLAARLRIGPLGVAAALGIASFALNVALIEANPVATFYLPFTRAWELLAGAALACAWKRIPQDRSSGNGRAGLGVVLIVVAAALLDPHRAFPGWWAVLPVAGGALLLSAPSAWGARHLLASRPMVAIGQISYPLYLWHWPLLVFAAIIKFAPLTLIESELVVLASALLAWITYRLVEIPLRYGAPGRLRPAGLCASMVLIAIAGGVVVGHGGLASRLPPEIRDMAEVRPQSAQWRVHTCLLDLAHETAFADECVERNRRPLVLLWGDSTAGALMPGLRRAQETRDFGIAQLTSSSCIPALNADIAVNPNCRSTNDKVLALARQIQPDIVLLHAAFAQHLDHVGETVTALKQHTGARVVVLGPVPGWKRGLPNEVLRYYLLHRELIPQRTFQGATTNGYDATMRGALVPLGAELISAWEALCEAEGCLTRVSDNAADLTASDRAHLTEKGSIFLVESIIDRVLGERAADAAR
jgi:peptidoglycan/LPS O-acetylase OafA/YrhL